MNTTATPSHTDTADLNNWFDQRFEEKMAEREAAYTPSVTIIASKGTLDMAYPPFILASTAAALGWEASIFFTFYGLALLKKKLDLKVTPLGNPAMPSMLPTSVMSITPGFERLYTGMMKKRMYNKGIASVEELRDLCIEGEVKMIGCQMSADLFGWEHGEFIEGVVDWVGATSFLSIAHKADVNLFI